MGPVGTFGHMDDQNLVLREFFNPDGHRWIARGGHICYLRQDFIGRIATDDLVAIIDADQNTAAGGIGKGHQFLGKIRVDATLEFQGIALALFKDEGQFFIRCFAVSHAASFSVSCRISSISTGLNTPRIPWG